MENIFEKDICDAINKITDEGYSNIKSLNELPIDKAREILSILLEFACKGQTHAYINISRKLILQIPLNWLLENFIIVVETTIDLNDEWEYRRMLELASYISKELLKWGVDIGLNSKDTEINEAAEDFKERVIE